MSGSLPLRLFYLAFFFAIGASSPYTSLYLQSIHLSGAQIGLIASITPIAGVLLPPLWGLLSDRRGWRSQVQVASLICAALCAFVVAASEPLVSRAEARFVSNLGRWRRVRTSGEQLLRLQDMLSWQGTGRFVERI